MKIKKTKGISPLVAVIMLIAFTLIMAGVLSVWIQGFASERTRTLGTCTDARALIQSGSYDSGTETLRLTIYNYGRVPQNFTTILKYSDDNFTTDDTQHATQPRSIESFNIAGVSPNLQEVTIRSVECEGLQDFLRDIDIRGLGF